VQTADALFRVVDGKKSSHEFFVTVSIYQIAISEEAEPRATDMLNPRLDADLRVVDHRAFGGAYLEPMAELEVRSAQQLKEYLTQAIRVQELLQLRSGSPNKPHTIYDIRVESKVVQSAQVSIQSARLRFAELAGQRPPDPLSVHLLVRYPVMLTIRCDGL
jgi:hypothetical protein